MKAKRKQPKFEPVEITLETEDELNYLWHCLDLKPQFIEKSNPNQAVCFPRDVNALKMWEELDKIVRPNLY